MPIDRHIHGGKNGCKNGRETALEAKPPVRSVDFDPLFKAGGAAGTFMLRRALFDKTDLHAHHGDITRSGDAAFSTLRYAAMLPVTPESIRVAMRSSDPVERSNGPDQLQSRKDLAQSRMGPQFGVP
jgi:hypothetical protein